MFSANPRVSMGLIIFTVLIRKYEKQWKVLRDCLQNLPMGLPSGHQTFPRGAAGNPLGNFSRQPQQTFHFLYHCHFVVQMLFKKTNQLFFNLFTKCCVVQSLSNHCPLVAKLIPDQGQAAVS